MFYSVIVRTEEMGFEDFRFTEPAHIPDSCMGTHRAYLKKLPYVVDVVYNKRRGDVFMAAFEVIASNLTA